MHTRYLGAIVLVAVAGACGQMQDRQATTHEADAIGGGDASASLRRIVQGAPKLSLEGVELKVVPPTDDWQLGSISWIAADRTSGRIYLFHRGDTVDPIVVVERDGRVLRSWGKGTYTKAHALRVDPQGNIWTVDAATSIVRKYSPDGRTLMEINVGGRPSVCMDQQIVPASERPTGANNFCGATDVAFAPNGHVFVADGYANNRILEYSETGRKLKEWDSAGTGPGQFRLPHSITIDKHGTIYVSDRENGRIQRFDLTGKYLGEWPNLGRVYSLEISDEAMWIVTQPLELPNSAAGWLLKMHRATGAVLGYADVTDGHGVAAFDRDEPMITGPNGTSVLWFRPVP